MFARLKCVGINESGGALSSVYLPNFLRSARVAFLLFLYL